MITESLSTEQFAIRLLEEEPQPIWQRWNRDVPKLLNVLWDLSKVRPASLKVLWLLDRLSPCSDPTPFAASRDHWYGLYAWGRRLAPAERPALLEIPLRSVQIEVALSAAWCESCPEDDLESLLDSPRIDWGVDPIREYLRRVRDPERVAAMWHREMQGRRSNAWLLRLEYEVRDKPWKLPDRASSEPIESWCAANAPVWLKDYLARRSLGWKVVADRAWCLSHGRRDWRRLWEAMLSNRVHGDVDHFAEIAPPAALECWESLLDPMGERGEETIRAFSRWLPRRLAEALRVHFNASSHLCMEWAASAYQAYLHRTNRHVLLHQRRCHDLPAWQLRLLDRFLFAPPAVRPAPLIEDIQTAENCPRLLDPFNCRSF